MRVVKNVPEPRYYLTIRARVEEILAPGAERAEITVEQVLRELAVLGFSDIGKVVRWRPELVCEEFEDADNPDQPPRQVLQSRVRRLRRTFRDDFTFDKEWNLYTCPAGKTLTTTGRLVNDGETLHL
jgi:hypothetical protein